MNRDADFSAEDLRRLPGLYRRWELPHVIEVGVDYRIEDAGEAGDGTPLFAVYRRGTSEAAAAPFCEGR